MTVESTLARIVYTISGAGPYTIPFYFLDQNDLIVIRTPNGGNAITLVLTTDYTVTGEADENGGLLTLVSPVNGDVLTIINEPPIDQLTDYPETGKFPAASHERALDKLTMIAKRVFDLTTRSLRLNDGDPATALVLPTPVAGKYLGFGITGALELLDGTGSATDAEFVSYNQGGTGAATISIADKAREWVSVNDFGADPTGAADSAAAFTAAAVESSTVIVPSGTWKLNSSPTGAITWIVMQGATFTGAGVLPGTMMRVGAVNFELRRVDNASFPFNYETSGVAGVVQWDNAATLGANGQADGFVFRFQSTGDGNVALDGSLSGGASTSIWRGLYSGMTKSGDGSGHSYTANGQLGAVGATGYNELGGFIYSGTNIGSIRGTIHGSELLVRDGTGTEQTSGTAQAGGASTITLAAGASAVDDVYNNYAIHITGGTGSGQYRRITDYVGSTKVATVDTAWSVTPNATSTYEVIAAYDTFLCSHIARNARRYGGSRKSISYVASSEGAVVSSSILEALAGGPGWTTGIDFSQQSFAGGRWAITKRGQFIGIDDGAGTISNMFGASSLGVAVIKGTNANETTQVQKQDGTVLMQFDGQLSAGNPIQLVIAGTLKQVTAGANDSGGAGYKLLRVTN